MDTYEAAQHSTLPRTVTSLPQDRITFLVRGLASKDERVFKSFVRLVAHRTLHLWQAAEGAAEVCVAASPALQGGAPHLMLVVPEGTASDVHHVEMPFRATDLERVLNTMGEFVVKSRRASAPRGTLPARMRLVRWPSADLLRAAQRTRLATAMSGKVMSLQELHLRTSVPYDACAAFAHELLALGFLAAAQAAPEDATVPAMLEPSPHAGLLARIRDRLSRITTSRT